MRRSAIRLDFARQRAPVNGRGIALLLIGIIGASLVLFDYYGDSQQREGLELRIEDLNASHRVRRPDKVAERRLDEARAAFAELTMPWSKLLQELEAASAESQGSIAVLGVEPDREKRQVHVIAEARTLSSALAYVSLLQKSSSLRYPMLESHEEQLKDPQRPVRFQVRADWSTAP